MHFETFKQLYLKEPVTLKEKIYKLYAFNASEDEKNFLKKLKELEYINGFLIDSDGIKYKKKELIATIDIKFIQEYPRGSDFSGLKDIYAEQQKIGKQILSLEPRPHGFLEIEHPDARKFREFLKNDTKNNESEELNKRIGNINYAIKTIKVSDVTLIPAFEEMGDPVDTVIQGNKFYTIKEPDFAKIEIHRVEFYYLGE